MADPSKSGRIAVWSLSLATLSMIVVLGTLWWCRCYRLHWPYVPVKAVNLIIEDENTAAWMTSNNAFALGSAVEPDTTMNRDYWTGVLFQLGSQSGSENRYAGVELYKGSTRVDSLGPGDFAWINIVSEADPGTDVPMDPDHAFMLYPNDKPGSNRCEAIDDCVTSSCPDPDPGFDRTWCLRSQRLHGGLPPQAIITYWQGEDGFSFSAEQKVGPNNLSNEQRFTFNDGFTVTVYQVVVDDDGNFKMECKYTGCTVDVDLIKVKYVTEGPTNGTKKDPPWPPGNG